MNTTRHITHRHVETGMEGRLPVCVPLPFVLSAKERIDLLKKIEEIRDSVLGGFDHLQEERCLKRKEAERLKSFVLSLNGAELLAVVSSCGGVGMALLEAQGVAVRGPMPASWD